MKTKRIYRFLKPNEKIQYGDWFTIMVGAALTSINTNRLSYDGWVQVKNVDDFFIGRTPSQHSEFLFARFVTAINPPVKRKTDTSISPLV